MRRLALGAVLAVGALALGACGDDPPSGPPTSGTGADRFAVGDRLGGADAPTWPLLADTLQPTADDGFAMTCGALVCAWDAAGGPAREAGVGGDALHLERGNEPGIEQGIEQEVALDAVQDQVLVADVGSGEVTAVFEGHVGTDSADTLPVVSWVVLSPDGTLAASSGKDGRTFLWRTADGEEVAQLDPYDGARATTPVFSPDGGLLALTWSGGSTDPEVGAATVVDVASSDVVAEPEGLDRALAWAPDGSVLVGSDTDGEATAWDAAGDWTAVDGPDLPSPGPAAISPDSRTVVVRDRADDTLLRLWDLDSGDVREVATRHPDPVVDLAFSDDGRFLASASTETAEPGITPDDPRDVVEVRPVDGGPAARLLPPRG